MAVDPRATRSMGRRISIAIAVAAITALLAGPATAVAADPRPRAAADRDGDLLTDAFEREWGDTDHRDADSDNDGVEDSAEDPDGDRLSNLGEQRYSTSPVNPDTDGDGIRDGREDRDGDGKSNAAEQDARPVPSGLLPSLGSARTDLPKSYANGCHSGVYVRSIHPCAFGDPDGSVRIALFGDSHALQWLPALDRAGKARGWRVVAITKSACPSADVIFQEPNFKGARASCLAWRHRGERWIQEHRLDLVIIANSRGYRVLKPDGTLVPKSRRPREWQRGLDRTLQAMPAGPRILVLGDTPASRKNIPACLKANLQRISACQRSRSASTDSAHDDAERAAAEANGATFRSLNRKVCSYDPCPVIVGKTLLWRDGTHLTATYVRRLTPAIRDIVRSTLSAD
jgi:hypothetical protein